MWHSSIADYSAGGRARPRVGSNGTLKNAVLLRLRLADGAATTDQAVDLALGVTDPPDVLQVIDALAAAGRAEAHVEVAGAEAQEPQAEHAMHEDVVTLAQRLDLRGGEVLAALA